MEPRVFYTHRRYHLRPDTSLVHSEGLVLAPCGSPVLFPCCSASLCSVRVLLASLPRRSRTAVNQLAGTAAAHGLKVPKERLRSLPRTRIVPGAPLAKHPRSQCRGKGTPETKSRTGIASPPASPRSAASEPQRLGRLPQDPGVLQAYAPEGQIFCSRLPAQTQLHFARAARPAMEARSHRQGHGEASEQHQFLGKSLAPTHSTSTGMHPWRFRGHAALRSQASKGPTAGSPVISPLQTNHEHSCYEIIARKCRPQCHHSSPCGAGPALSSPNGQPSPCSGTLRICDNYCTPALRNARRSGPAAPSPLLSLRCRPDVEPAA
jgi:hypothetical protein